VSYWDSQAAIRPFASTIRLWILSYETYPPQCILSVRAAWGGPCIVPHDDLHMLREVGDFVVCCIRDPVLELSETPNDSGPRTPYPVLEGVWASKGFPVCGESTALTATARIGKHGISRDYRIADNMISKYCTLPCLAAFNLSHCSQQRDKRPMLASLPGARCSIPAQRTAALPNCCMREIAFRV